ncbi:iron uptake porin [Limnofasciculus baicalensis]|uniref:Iron uptake porin n=1 Tax=Limnofasciculus baicalensis BBK-W-15 TaxID=2699891 RepID=A0AAE3GU50_9CYAN|nr:iron uptake porin [Limnofasciculus baicalensis]MCP2730389.1 iron uptake porin [Limnofasciculus baicalensis BBK-W-15]
MEIRHIRKNLRRFSPVMAPPGFGIALLLFCNGAIAAEDPKSSILEQVEGYNDSSLEQLTSVSQLRDVQPGDWAYEALRSLVERYGAIIGYRDAYGERSYRTFRGNRRMTRYEFAAALLHILDGIQLQVARGEKAPPPPELKVLEKLTEDFVLELSLVRGDVDAITARTRELELTQFSTTTTLEGEAIIGVAGIVTGDDNIGDTTILGHRTRLTLETSFTGKDLLETQLQAEGLGLLESRTQTPEGELAFTGDSDSDLNIDKLLYSFPLNNRTKINIAAHGVEADELVNTLNPYLDGDGASGAISRFATRQPIYNLVSGAGVGVTHTLNDKLEVSVAYLAGDASNPNSGAGLFNGAYGGLAQVVYQPSDRTTLSLTYVNAYNRDLETGSSNANLFEKLGLPVATNSLGIATSVQINPQITIGGWAGYTGAKVIDEGDASIWNWALTLSFPDLGKKGNLAGVIIGMEPKVIQSDDSLENLGIEDSSTSLHLEAFYQYQLTDKIAITPGIIWLTAPNHNSSNGDVVIGTVRTTFRF